jgi:predicted RNA-binding Zn ribbon-like protein
VTLQVVDGSAEIAVAGNGVPAALGRLLAIAFGAMLDGSWPRLKVCRQCRWAFYDYSRNRSGSWCSMTLCGNRAKTRSYRRRKAGARQR